jgi:hypothetical protein
MPGKKDKTTTEEVPAEVVEDEVDLDGELEADEDDLLVEDLDDDDIEDDDIEVRLGDDVDVDADDEDEDDVVLIPVAVVPEPGGDAEASEEGDDDDDLDDDEVEASLDVILKERLVVVEEEDEEDDDPDVADADDRADGTTRVLPKQPGEFVCQSCFLVKNETQLADAKRKLCRDCV